VLSRDGIMLSLSDNAHCLSQWRPGFSVHKKTPFSRQKPGALVAYHQRVSAI